MSGIWNTMDTRARRLGLIEVKLAQGAAMGVMLIIVKIFPGIMDLHVGWFVAFTILCALRPMKTYFGDE